MKVFWKVVFGAFLGTLLALFILLALGIGAVGSLAALGSKESAAPVKSAILKIDASCSVSEQEGESFALDIASGSFTMAKSLSLLKAVQAIDEAAKDPAIKFIYINADGLANSISINEELREALERFRSSGKAVVAYSSSLTGGGYYLSSVADKVILNTYADCMIEGVSSMMIFYKDLIDRLGVDIQLIRHGKYKSAGEPYILNDISDENRAQYDVLLTSMWNTMAKAMAQSRDFTVEQLNGWINNLEIKDAQTAKSLGLVDELWFEDELQDYLCALSDVKEAKDLNFVTLTEYAAQKVKPNYKVKDKIAIIYADGQMAMGDSGEGSIGDRFAREIAKVRSDSTVKAVVLRVNSPGGAVQAAAVIKRELDLLGESKPVIASFGEYAASGGYWISAASDKIYSDESTMTGSIGVFGLVPSFGRAINKNLHINVVELSSHRHGGMANGIQPLDEQEEEFIRYGIEKTYNNFVSLVSQGRGMSADQVDEIAQGRVWIGADALEVGLVDEIGGLQEAISYAALAAGLENYRIAEYPAPKSMSERLMEMFGSSVKAGSEKIAESAADGFKWILEQDSPLIMAMMPYCLVNVK